MSCDLTNKNLAWNPQFLSIDLVYLRDEQEKLRKDTFWFNLNFYINDFFIRNRVDKFVKITIYSPDKCDFFHDIDFTWMEIFLKFFTNLVIKYLLRNKDLPRFLRKALREHRVMPELFREAFSYAHFNFLIFLTIVFLAF